MMRPKVLISQWTVGDDRFRSCFNDIGHRSSHKFHVLYLAARAHLLELLYYAHSMRYRYIYIPVCD
jgi:hypothetical protein